MAENLKSDSGVLAKASQTVDTHRAEQSAIGQRVQSAAAESQSGWQGQGATAVAQVVQQYGEDAGQALGLPEVDRPGLPEH